MAGVCWLWLIDRSQFDSDDEVRDRATFYLNVLNEQQKALNLTYIINGASPLHCGVCLITCSMQLVFALVALSLYLFVSVSLYLCVFFYICLSVSVSLSVNSIILEKSMNFHDIS